MAEGRQVILPRQHLVLIRDLMVSKLPKKGTYLYKSLVPNNYRK